MSSSFKCSEATWVAQFDHIQLLAVRKTDKCDSHLFHVFALRFTAKVSQSCRVILISARLWTTQAANATTENFEWRGLDSKRITEYPSSKKESQLSGPAFSVVPIIEISALLIKILQKNKKDLVFFVTWCS